MLMHYREKAYVLCFVWYGDIISLSLIMRLLYDHIFGVSSLLLCNRMNGKSASEVIQMGIGKMTVAKPQHNPSKHYCVLD